MGLSNLKILSQSFFSFTSKRTFMASSIRLQKALKNLEKNEYYDKYAEKIAKLQKTSPEEFLSRVEELTKEPPKKNPEQTADSKFSQLLKPKKPIDNPETAEASLDKIMKLELVEDKSVEEIGEIWRQYHLERGFISAIIPAKDYEEIILRSKEFPMFLFPLPRNQGYEFIMLQFQGNSVHFTPLLYYQVHKENAPECLTVTHFMELKDSKNIVLMCGEYDKNIIDFKEAQCLANQLQLYYLRPSGDKVGLMGLFTKKPDAFRHMELIKQIETLSL